MSAVFVFLIALISYAHTCSLQDTELMFTFMVNRHGDKTPFKYLLQLGDNSGKLENLFKPFGYGELSDAGKDRCYEVGKYIRKRYGSLLSPTFVPDELFVRSSYNTRTIESTLMALAGIYGLDKSQYKKTMTWLPLPYSTVLPKYDYNSPFLNCPAFLSKTKYMIKLPIPGMGPYHSACHKLSQEFKFNVTDNAIFLPLIYDLINIQKTLGLGVSKKIDPILPVIKAAASHCLKKFLGDPKLLGLQSGVLLNEFFRVAGLAMSGKKFPKVYIHSAHDFNVYSLLCATKAIPNPGPPPFGSIYALEFRKEIPTGKYFVLPMFVSHPGKPETYLTVKGCGGIFCEFNKFQSLTKQFAMDINQWRSACGWNEDMNIDICNINK